MASLIDSANLAQDAGFRLRVRMAALRAAVNIAAEGPSGDDRVDGLRANLANRVLNDSSGYQDQFAWAVATNGAVSDAGVNSPDGDIEFTVGSLWNALAGV